MTALAGLEVYYWCTAQGLSQELAFQTARHIAGDHAPAIRKVAEREIRRRTSRRKGRQRAAKLFHYVFERGF